MDEYGLSAVVLYEIPGLDENTDANSVKPNSFQWTLTDIFGDGINTENPGISVEELLDGIDVRMVYIPSYACTSFVTGQIMNAEMHNSVSADNDMTPMSSLVGIELSVDLEGSESLDNGLGVMSKSALNLVQGLWPIHTQAVMDREQFPISSDLTRPSNTTNSSSVPEPMAAETRRTPRAPTLVPELTLPLRWNPNLSENDEWEQWELDWVEAELCVPGNNFSPVAVDPLFQSEDGVKEQEKSFFACESEGSVVLPSDIDFNKQAHLPPLARIGSEANSLASSSPSRTTTQINLSFSSETTSASSFSLSDDSSSSSSIVKLYSFEVDDVVLPPLLAGPVIHTDIPRLSTSESTETSSSVSEYSESTNSSVFDSSSSNFNFEPSSQVSSALFDPSSPECFASLSNRCRSGSGSTSAPSPKRRKALGSGARTDLRWVLDVGNGMHGDDCINAPRLVTVGEGNILHMNGSGSVNDFGGSCSAKMTSGNSVKTMTE
ncbi:hypothetical protein BDP27DRAFT_1447151 [Rhodocollybia butyracea]|uniref:Uncharacterized protein n=1 Tax=Rhodocollybia butyracea TaxID=206335 RepID=A0A9P5PQ25_9AGAR|nr:hypothetical protein BDP27DRAFT_1447151 [Rhodocollybia butyracea]